MPECEDCAAPATAGVFCHDHAPLYAVHDMHGELYVTRNLRRAWEAMRFHRARGYFETSIFVPERVELDHDGLTESECALLDSWCLLENGRVARVHLCLAKEAA